MSTNPTCTPFSQDYEIFVLFTNHIIYKKKKKKTLELVLKFMTNFSMATIKMFHKNINKATNKRNFEVFLAVFHHDAYF